MNFVILKTSHFCKAGRLVFLIEKGIQLGPKSGGVATERKASLCRVDQCHWAIHGLTKVGSSWTLTCVDVVQGEEGHDGLVVGVPHYLVHPLGHRVPVAT